MSDFNEVVKRVTMDRSFRGDLLKDVDGTLAAHNYKISGEELAELKRLDNAKLDQLDEKLLEQAVGGVTTSMSFGSTSILSGYPLMQTSLTSLYQQNAFSGFARPGTGSMAGSW